MPRGCGFFEYTASESADLACLGLQNHPAGGGKFFAIRADYLLAAPVPTPLTALSSLTAQSSPTPILCLANMVSPRDIDSPEDYADVMEDVRSECLLHGAVLSIHIPQPSKPSSSVASSNSSSTSVSNPANLGKIFVEFATAQQAQAASLALEGRKYNGRTVSTSFCDPARYAAGDFGWEDAPCPAAAVAVDFITLNISLSLHHLVYLSIDHYREAHVLLSLLLFFEASKNSCLFLKPRVCLSVSAPLFLFSICHEWSEFIEKM